MTVVFPVPAPAATNVTSSSVAMALACSRVRSSYPSFTTVFDASSALALTNVWLALLRFSSSVTIGSMFKMSVSILAARWLSLSTSSGVQREVTTCIRDAAFMACDFLTYWSCGNSVASCG